MTDIQLLKTGFQPWLTPADRARLTVLLAQETAARETLINDMDQDEAYAAAEAALNRANALFRAVWAQHKAGTVTDKELDDARELRRAARVSLEHAYNHIIARQNHQRRV